MFRAITLILFFASSVFAGESQFLTVFINHDEGQICLLDIEDGDEDGKVLFERPKGVTLSSATIAVNQMGQAAVAWVESSRCYTSFYDGSWSDPVVVSDPVLKVFSTPSLTMDSEYDLSIVYLATGDESLTLLQMNHLEGTSWTGPETIYVTPKSIVDPLLAADLFGKKFVSWTNLSDETVQVLEKYPRAWKISLVSPANTNLTASISPLADGSFMLAWMTPQNCLQTALYRDGWIYQEELPIDRKVISIMLTDVEDSVMLLWILDGDDLEGEVALFNGESWDRLDLSDLLMDFDTHDM